MAKKKKQRRIAGLLLLILLMSGILLYYAYIQIFGPMVRLKEDQKAFYIHTGWTHEDVLEALEEGGYIAKPELLELLMDQKNYSGSLVVPGKYTLNNGMSANALINHLRAGNGEEEVRIVFNTARTAEELAGKAAANIEADSLSILSALTDREKAEAYGFSTATFLAMFLPDTYNAEWDTDADGFIARMADEYKKFWTPERKAKAQSIGLSQSEVTILASIVQAEQQMHPEERPAIAGLYLNRLERGMRLQSDPTVVYALGDFNINRVLTVHLSTPSPYNTYLNKGLPPGPINIPSKQSIDAVLNAEDNKYIYMCAKADFSGYHAFATNLAEHNRNARAFQQAMNQRGIYR